MSGKNILLTGAIVCLCGTAALSAEDIPVRSDKLPGWLQLGGQVRGRLEDPSGASMADNNPDGYYLSRIRLNLGIKPTPWLRFFAETQDGRVAGYKTRSAPGAFYNPVDLRQGYVELKLERRAGFTIRAGRQELLFGGERLIGPADWGMSRTFDAVDVGVSMGRAGVHLFGGSPVLIDPTRFDRHKPGEHLYGAYGSIRQVLPGVNVEPYVLFKQTLNVKSEFAVLGDAMVVSPGVRFFGNLPGRVDYTLEMVMQRGSYSGDKVLAEASSAAAGWTLNGSRLKPRVSAEYNYASGDPTGKDGHRDTFDQLYPSNHAYYGMIDQFGWKNMKNYRAGFDCTVAKKLRLRADFNEFYLATVQDALYNSGGSAVVWGRTATSAHIGSETNVAGVYQWSKIWKFGAGLGHLFAGEYLKQSKIDFGYTYPYLMFAGSF